MEVLDGGSEEEGWTRVSRRGERKADLWQDLGLPSLVPKTWSSTPGSPIFGSAEGRSSSRSHGRRAAAVARPIRVGWRGPLPRPRVTPPAVLGMFLPASPPPADRVIAGKAMIQTGDGCGPNVLGRTGPWAYL